MITGIKNHAQIKATVLTDSLKTSLININLKFYYIRKVMQHVVFLL